MNTQWVVGLKAAVSIVSQTHEKLHDEARRGFGHLRESWGDPRCSKLLLATSLGLEASHEVFGRILEVVRKVLTSPAMRFSARARPTTQCGDLTAAQQLAWSSPSKLAAVAPSAGASLSRSPWSASLLGRLVVDATEKLRKVEGCGMADQVPRCVLGLYNFP